ncbi:hypothetical protein FOA52_008625 [Chlamydomonas sp. UWO 241]|nr:hypothetical protein FOA52_008625 [Chlamydomonas sp. UWO 241]
MNRRFGGPGFARPENALKRAEELVKVGQSHAALQALHDIITSKKHRTWSKTYEEIMYKHIDLTVESKRRNYAKEALSSYRNMCQAVNIGSLEEVIKYFLAKASSKAEEAQAKANAASAAVIADATDLDEDGSPEDMMLSYVSADKGKDRTDRELVTPWFRFLWDSYRSVLEILRINPKLESLYAMVAVKAFNFCKDYKRNQEFRRLCDILRQHLANQLNRYRDSRENHADSLQLHVDTRFEQLKVACDLELWAEAFRSVEDIQQLILQAKKTPKQQMMATYYACLTQIFAVSENHTYHAYAWLKLFNFTKTYNKNIAPEDLRAMASSVMLATLSILPYERQDRFQDENAADQEKERTVRMANILGFAVSQKVDYRSVLSRAGLLQQTTGSHIMGTVPAEIRELFELLTSQFNPLELCTNLAPLFEKLEQAPKDMSGSSPVKSVHLARYIPNLKMVAVLRLLKQLSDVYSSLKISSLAAMVPFAAFGEVESIIVDAVRYGYLQVRIDHRHGTLHFGSQQLESDKVRSHLSSLAKHLSNAVGMIDPPAPDAKEARRAAAISAALQRSAEEHKLMNARKIMIEKRKEEQELALMEQEQEEERMRAIKARETELAEEKRRKEEALQREIDRMTREKDEQDAKEALELYNQQNAKKGKAAVTSLAGVAAATKDEMVHKVMSERLKEQQEMERKLNKAGKLLDHMERARREEEVPYLQAAYVTRMEEDKGMWEQQQATHAAEHRAAWELDVIEKARLATMVSEKSTFAAQIMARRQEEFKELSAERERLQEQRAAQRARDRDAARRREFVRRCNLDVEARVAELTEEYEKEEAARQAAAEVERAAEVLRVAERQKLREAEIEAKQKLEKEQAGRAPPPQAAAASSGGAFVPSAQRGSAAAGGGGGDRWGGGGGGGGGYPAERRDDRRDDRLPVGSGGDGGGDRWSRPAAGARDDAPPRAAAPSVAAPPADGAPPKSKFVPPHLRGK